MSGNEILEMSNLESHDCKTVVSWDWVLFGRLGLLMAWRLEEVTAVLYRKLYCNVQIALQMSPVAFINYTCHYLLQCDSIFQYLHMLCCALISAYVVRPMLNLPR